MHIAQQKRPDPFDACLTPLTRVTPLTRAWSVHLRSFEQPSGTRHLDPGVALSPATVDRRARVPPPK